GSYPLYFMSRGATSLFAAGTLDEVRISNILRSPDWIVTDYNNQSSPETFITMGSESCATPTPTPSLCQRSITIDHTKVPSTQSNFTVLVSVTDPTLKTVANGGHVANPNGYDIGFYADSGGTTKLKWEVEKYNGTTGNLIAWVKIPSVSSSTDTVFY